MPKKINTSQIQIDTRQCRIETSIVPNTLNVEARTVELTWSTGYKGLRRTWFGDYYEELSMDEGAVNLKRLNAGAPLLAAHDAYSLDSVIGVVERAWLDPQTKEGKAVVRFASDDASEVIFQKVKDGILRNISVGYDVAPDGYELVESSNPNEDDDIPTYRAIDWEPMEISIVPVGFDPHAQIRSKEKNEKSLKTYNIRNKSEVTQMDEIEKQKAEAAAKALAEAEAKRKADVEAAVKAEQARCLEIRNVVKEAGFDEGLADEYIKGNLTVEAARTNVELFKKYSIEKRNNTVASTTSVEVTTVNEEQRRQAIEEALLHRLDSQNFKLTERAREFAGGSVMRAMERHFPRKQFESDIEYAQRTMSSSDLPLILANVAEKSAQKRYELAPRTFAAWTSSGTLNNYKEATQVRGGDVGELKKRNEAGEYEESNIGEEGEKVQLEQYGVVHKFTDKMLVNDDLGMILEIANDSGTAVARLENKLAYEQLLTNPKMGDGENLFDKTKHGNVGTVGAIGETTFSEAFRDMRNQSTVDKRDKLNLSPMFLIVGPALETAAKKFLATITPTDSTDVNIFSNSVKIVVDPLITDDHYFFAADPSRINTVKIFRLAGKESAQVSSRVNWRNDAIELKIAHSVAAKAMDYRGLYRNKATSGQ